MLCKNLPMRAVEDVRPYGFQNNLVNFAFLVHGVPEKAFFRDMFRLLLAFRETPLLAKKPFLG